MYSQVDVLDLTKVVQQFGVPLPQPATEVPVDRTDEENSLFAFTLIVLLFGMVAALLESVVLVWVYTQALILSFILAVTALPSALYTTRYIIDAYQLMVAMRLRANMMTNVAVVSYLGGRGGNGDDLELEPQSEPAQTPGNTSPSMPGNSATAAATAAASNEPPSPSGSQYGSPPPRGRQSTDIPIVQARLTHAIPSPGRFLA
jgi:hypothetical protein